MAVGEVVDEEVAALVVGVVVVAVSIAVAEVEGQ